VSGVNTEHLKAIRVRRSHSEHRNHSDQSNSGEHSGQTTANIARLTMSARSTTKQRSKPNKAIRFLPALNTQRSKWRILVHCHSAVVEFKVEMGVVVLLMPVPPEI
jgi:hypothetical protein